MFHLVVSLTVRDQQDIPRVSDALARMRTLVRREPGCLAWEALHSTSDPHLFTLVETWETEEAWHAHDDLEAIQTIYLPEITTTCEREVHPSVLV